jgi:DNA-binding transcriptional ArsR family regulator
MSAKPEPSFNRQWYSHRQRGKAHGRQHSSSGRADRRSSASRNIVRAMRWSDRASECARLRGAHVGSKRQHHLAKLTEGGLPKVENQGRHRYYRLASPHVAMVIEALASLAPPIRSLETPLSREARSLRFGRSCYDHLAGRLGIAVTARLQAAAHLKLVDDDAKHYAVSEPGRHWFKTLGIELAALRPSSRGLARRCLDWTERRHHLAGPLGGALLSRFVDLGWLRRDCGTRAVSVTGAGVAGLAHSLGLDVRELDDLAPVRDAS